MSGSEKADPAICRKAESPKQGRDMVTILTRKTSRLSTGNKALRYGHLQKTDPQKRAKSTPLRIGPFFGNPVKTC